MDCNAGFFYPIGGNPVQSRWDGTKKVTWRGGGTPMVIVTVEGPTDLRLNCNMLSWRSIDEALVVGGQ